MILRFIKIYKGFTKAGIGKLFAYDLNVKGTREHSLKLEKVGCARECTSSHRE